MALVPFLYDEVFDSEPSWGELYDQHFGLGLSGALYPEGRPLPTALRSGYLRPWRQLPALKTGVSQIKLDKEGFKVRLDVQEFKSEELKVWAGEGYLRVEGRHDERTDDFGSISRQFTRKYKLPANVDQNALRSNLSSDGVLTVEAPLKRSSESNIIEIPIIQSNTPAILE